MATVGRAQAAALIDSEPGRVREDVALTALHFTPCVRLVYLPSRERLCCGEIVRPANIKNGAGP